MMVEIIPIPAFQDNYIWLLQRDGHAVVVDPGDAQPVLETLQRRQLQLDAILITHHHADHVGGVEILQESYPTMTYAPAKEHYAFPHLAVGEGDVVSLPTLGITLQVMETPGHTLGHVVYYGENWLFCGDTLFGCGCGRLFEGSCQQLYHSLQRLAALPEQTQVYCTHEYTLHNLRFALTIDPENTALQQRQRTAIRQRAAGQPTLPSTIALECATNPFLRCRMPSVLKAAQTTDAETAFCRIRSIRNSL